MGCAWGLGCPQSYLAVLADVGRIERSDHAGVGAPLDGPVLHVKTVEFGPVDGHYRLP